MLLPGWCAEDTDATDATEAEDKDAAAEDVDAIEALTESKYVVSVFTCLIMLHVYVNIENTHELLGRLVGLVVNHPVFGRCA